ncbi:MAG: YicC/YloC family endoribonuclease [Christensenellaceae bacterium]
MTGFGKSEIAIDGRKIRVEIKSVNHRFLDISIRQPRFLMFLEDDVRKLLKMHLNRGRIDVFINYSSEREDAKKVLVDMPLVRAYVEAANQIVKQTEIKDDLAISHIMRLPDVVTYEEEDSDEEALKDLLTINLNAALAELMDARQREGNQLKNDIVKRLDLILESAQRIHEKEDTVVGEYKQKLNDRLKEILDGSDVDQQKLAQEVAFFADRCNITEEIVRIKSHVKHFKASMEENTPQGRNMDFIVQELNREFNTIGSKSQDMEIVEAVIAGKGEIEKIREQIQNIE